VGLPDDRCQCAHWGVVLRGQLTYRYADGEEVIRAGEAYYCPPGHTPILSAGTEIIEFSPTEQLAATMEVVIRNLQGAGAAG
jgi:quercetin dioxygenase-like cupin family protein